ncbi:MAG: SpoIID/LytB domain-containing protein [bacterium]
MILIYSRFNVKKHQTFLVPKRIAYIFKHVTFMILLISLILIISCKAPLPKENKVRQPTIRVGILEERESVDFKVDAKLTFVNKNGGFALRGIAGGRWRVEAIETKPAQFVYRLSVGIYKDRFSAEQKVRLVKDQALVARIQKFESDFDSSLPYVNRTVYRVVLDKKFIREEEAKLFQNAIREKINTEIVEEAVTEALGTLRFVNLDSDYSFEYQDPIRMSAADMQISDVEVGSGFHWETSEHRNYGGTLEFLIDSHGKITVVNELSLEEYIKGVVPSEMPIRFPLEALKAQAIAARVEALAKKGLRHPSKPFDLCDDVHCQVFSGKTKYTKTTNWVVESTRGLLMVYRNKLAEAFYAGVCGGHTENNENVWLMDPLPYLRGILDTGGKSKKRLSTPLQNEKILKKWVDSYPDVFCNTLRKKVPKSLNYSKKYFRWKIEYDRKELEEIIRNKTGEDFGLLIDLVPIKRGVSGRLIELEIVGTKKRFKIRKELAIRQALSKNTLYSACFYVKKQGGSRNLPKKFILKGAGWGHGVGMCQIGAAVMAESGSTFDEILKHYYKGIVLEKIY